jgi:hypothetical protein
MTEKWTKYLEAMQLRDQALVNLTLLALATLAAWIMYGWAVKALPPRWVSPALNLGTLLGLLLWPVMVMWLMGYFA